MSTPEDVISDITIDNYVYVEWDNSVNHRPAIKLLHEKGHIEAEEGGTKLTWPVEAGVYTPETVSGDEDISALYVPHKQDVDANISWCDKMVADRLSKFSLKKNRGMEALVKFRDKNLPRMVKGLVSQGSGSVTTGKGSISNDFLALDGAAYTGNGLPLYGLQSIFPTVTVTATSDKEATVTGTYAGISLATDSLVGTVDGATSDAWTPTCINTHEAAWTDTAGPLADNILEILSYGINEITFDPSDEELKPDCGILDKVMFQALRKALGDKQTFYLTNAVKKGEVFGLGMGVEYQMHDGIPFYWDSGMPSDSNGNGYILNFDQIWMHYLKPLGKISGDKHPGKAAGSKFDKMFETEVRYDDGRRGLTVSITFNGQFRINPRYQLYMKRLTP